MVDTQNIMNVEGGGEIYEGIELGVAILGPQRG